MDLARPKSLFALAILAVAALASASAIAPDRTAPINVVVGIAPEPEAIERLAQMGAQFVVPLTTIDATLAALPAGAIAKVAAWEDVRYVERTGLASFSNYQNDEQTGAGDVKRGLPPLPRPFTGAGVTVAVLDSGLDEKHPDFAGQIAGHLNFDLVEDFRGVLSTEAVDLYVETTSPTNPFFHIPSHGMVVGSVLAGTGVAAQGVDMSGVAPGVKMVDFLTCCASSGGGAFVDGATFLLAYDYMIRHQTDPQYPGGIRIATNTWGFAPGTAYPQQALTDAFRAAMDVGITTIFAAGNLGPDANSVMPPASDIPEILTLAASCPAIDGFDIATGTPCGEGDIASYSSRGSAIDVAAPAAGIWAAKYVTGAVNDNGVMPPPGDADRLATANNRLWYGQNGGTSFAAPYAAGVIAMMLEANAALTTPEIELILKSTARDHGPLGPDPAWGSGEVDAFAAVVAALEALE